MALGSMGGGNSVRHQRDIWVETDCDFICVHVVPREHWFDPSKWSTF